MTNYILYIIYIIINNPASAQSYVVLRWLLNYSCSLFHYLNMVCEAVVFGPAQTFTMLFVYEAVVKNEHPINFFIVLVQYD